MAVGVGAQVLPPLAFHWLVQFLFEKESLCLFSPATPAVEKSPLGGEKWHRAVLEAWVTGRPCLK